MAAKKSAGKRGYFSGVVYEAKKVEWPTGKKLNNMVLTVVVFCSIFAIIFLAMDFVVQFILRAIGA